MGKIEKLNDFEENNKQKLTKQEIKIFMVSALGSALEFYDFVVYVYFAGIISSLFFPSSSPVTALILTYSIFACGYFARLLGGILFSHIGDRQGRKKPFILAVFLMALPTFFIGLLPTYQSVGLFAPVFLVLCRFMQGLAIGGEIPGSLTYIYENVQKSYRGLACGSLFFGVTFGTFLGSTVGFVLTKYLSQQDLYNWGWRVPFLAGGVLGLFGVYLRNFLNETPVFNKIKNNIIKVPLKEVISNYKFLVFKSSLELGVVAVSVSLFMLYLPNYLKTYFGFQAGEILKINSFFVFIYSVSNILFGWFCDKYGPERVFRFSCIIFLLFVYPIFSYFSPNNFYPIFACYILMIVGTAASTASAMYLLIKSFPPLIRFSGASLSYNIAFAFLGGFTPLLATALIEKTHNLTSPAFLLIIVSLIALLNSFLSAKKIEKVHKTDFLS
ncbi:MFS transporter [Pigmentibacter sp. JX0631]|uniref:MFS transporter n=1 Tax=Pigmentibacter sp. JX0631 TaxID=2976982 RepID=UPI00246957D6|nr:MFS transporter [Pigmentibacter sp. JX0631]WGL59564.1 MFS transporter [Pigmentibacter sp. JX0631]